ncbi:MAG TPA: 6-carboxytetrahydropterin synthase QueD [Candidatus Binatia bacterium]|nr:6-carboxytetrahydropterin synthase QueD [Candidatus Binatia bacterium]
MRICKQFKFEAAHVLPHHPGKCSRLHGHSYRLEVFVDGPLHGGGPAAGMVEDFDEIARIVRAQVIDVLDHRSLNEFLENPTSELIVAWIWERLAPHLAGLAQLTLWETTTACAILSKGDVPAR